MAQAAILGFLGVLAATGTTQAKVAEVNRTSYYDVSGRSMDEVVDLIDRVGPTDHNGQRFQGRTDARIDWSFGFRRTAEGCEIRDVVTKLTVTMIMPRFVGSDPRLKERFDRSVNRLFVHENGHVHNAEGSAARIDAALTAVPAAPTCKALRTQANAVAHKLFDEGAAIDVAYDELTDHGRHQERAATLYAAAPEATSSSSAAAPTPTAETSAAGTHSTSSAGQAPPQ
jgi:predicted secreted Zn-dependent protease